METPMDTWDAQNHSLQNGHSANVPSMVYNLAHACSFFFLLGFQMHIKQVRSFLTYSSLLGKMWQLYMSRNFFLETWFQIMIYLFDLGLLCLSTSCLCCLQCCDEHVYCSYLLFLCLRSMRNAGVKGHGLLGDLFYFTVSANSFFKVYI